jgi:hypothetical protein
MFHELAQARAKMGDSVELGRAAAKDIPHGTLVVAGTRGGHSEEKLVATRSRYAHLTTGTISFSKLFGGQHARSN